MKKEITEYTATQLLELYARAEVKPVDVVRAYLGRIEEFDPGVAAFLEVFAEPAVDRARELEASGPQGRPLYGVPVAVKDNICMRGLPTTCASKMLEGYRPPYDATVIERLRDAGAVIIGKVNLDEFAMGSSTENSAMRVTRNPWNTDYAPGGSSGGSAAAVAARMAPVSLGSDKGGSIRQPAALCGIVGLKGTYGRVSRYGLIAFASSLDQIGPLAHDVRDCALVMQVISGHDEMDATTLRQPPLACAAGLEEGIEGLRIAVPTARDEWEIDGAVREAMRVTIEELRGRGVAVEEIDLPDMEASIACYYVLANAEASSNLARYDGVRYGHRADSDDLVEMYERTRGEGFGDEVKRRILLGTYVLSAGYYDAYYAQAQRMRSILCARFERIFQAYDCLILPTSPTPGIKLGERLDDPIAMYLSDIFTTPASIAGLPAISIPAGVSAEKLPIGMQLIAGAGQEAVLLRAAWGLERIYRFRERHSL